MTNFNVSVPENKISFFREFLDLIGVNYEEKLEDFRLTDKQKQILDERLKADKNNFIPAREALSKLRQKYEL